MAEPTELNVLGLAGFEGFLMFLELLTNLTKNGAQPHFKKGFQFNIRGEFFLDHKHGFCGKLNEKGWCIILPKGFVEGIEGIHVSPTHDACEQCEMKGRDVWIIRPRGSMMLTINRIRVH